MIIEFSTEVSTYEIEGPEPNPDNEPYMWQGSSGTTLNNVTAALAKEQSGTPVSERYGESLTKDMPGVGLEDTVHVVVVVYQDGDTFGTYGGHTKVMDAFTDFGEAVALKAALEAHGTSSFQMEFRGTEYYCSYAGYFEHIESIEVWGVRVKPYHEYKYGR